MSDRNTENTSGTLTSTLESECSSMESSFYGRPRSAEEHMTNNCNRWTYNWAV